MKVRHILLGVMAVVLAGMLITVPAVRTPPAQAATKPYIPLISKGFQHQFWQAVKQGAEQAAKDFNVTPSFRFWSARRRCTFRSSGLTPAWTAPSQSRRPPPITSRQPG